MKRTSLFSLIFATLLTAIPASAQTTTSYLIAMGDWQLCAIGIQMPGCTTIVPNTETYMLNIGGSNPATVAYSFTVTATLQNGTVKSLSGILNRSDNAAGFTTATCAQQSNSCTPFMFGGLVTGTSITVDQLVSIATARVNRISEAK